jgi:hypothetical protein
MAAELFAALLNKWDRRSRRIINADSNKYYTGNSGFNQPLTESKNEQANNNPEMQNKIAVLPIHASRTKPATSSYDASNRGDRIQATTRFQQESPLFVLYLTEKSEAGVVSDCYPGR